MEMQGTRVKVCHYQDVEAQAFGLADTGVSVRWLFAGL